MPFNMSFLSLLRDERVVLLLTYIRDDNEIKIPLPKTQYITQDTEDALQIDTLDKLLGHPNYSIREIAVKILCDRAANDSDTVQHLLHGITRPDYDTRMQCLRALATLTGQTNEGLAKLNSWKACTALVRSLELGLGDAEHPKLDDKHWDEYYLRDMAERFCLMFVLELINKYGADLLVRANFVEKWLAKQNWGNDEKSIQENFTYYMEHKNNRIVDIVTRIAHTRQGARAIIAAKLAARTKFTLSAETNITKFTVVLQIALADADFADEERTIEQVPRTREHSAEEQRLRRHNREAMVFNDGTRPIGREDIIERSRDSPS